ncbi:MAG: response regulator, partial [Rhodospirillales bacterium]|nr:response regulator [Rhodospirillales bacterium]
DNSDAREVLSSTVASLGWRNECLSSGTMAIERIRQQAACGRRYDVLLIDWKMPGIDGLETSAAIHASASIPVAPIIIMVTACGRDEVLRSDLAVHIDGVITKPVMPSALFNAVAEAKARQRGAPAAAVAVGEQSRALAGLRLLLVEDNDVNQEVACRILELEGAQVSVAGDGAQAVRALQDGKAAFNVVLMDVQMPVMDGLEATRVIRRDLGLKIPILALTADAMKAHREECLNAGMDDFIAKPFDVAAMIKVIARHALAAKPPDSAPPTAPPSLKDVAGIDYRQALRRVGGDEVLLVSLLNKVANTYDGAVAQVRALLVQGDSDGAARLMHTLRGAAGNVGAIHVASLATALEVAIRDEHEAECPKLLEQLEPRLGELVQGVGLLGQHVGADTQEASLR